jgi:hypothetical protein
MLRLAVGNTLDFLTPPGQLGRSQGDVIAFIHHVIDFAAEGVKRHDGAAALGRQEQEAVVERRAAGGALVLAILVGIHGVTL